MGHVEGQFIDKEQKGKMQFRRRVTKKRTMQQKSDVDIYLMKIGIMMEEKYLSRDRKSYSFDIHIYLPPKFFTRSMYVQNADLP